MNNEPVNPGKTMEEQRNYYKAQTIKLTRHIDMLMTKLQRIEYLLREPLQ